MGVVKEARVYSTTFRVNIRNNVELKSGGKGFANIFFFG
jgi:hypothetical protein